MAPSTQTARVHQIRREADGVVSLELRPSSGAEQFPQFTAGSHIDLHLPNGLIRSYSLCNAQGDHGRYVVAVAHDRNSRGGSSYVNTLLRSGAELQISLPRNNFQLDESAERYVLLAGGIGVTPLYSMLQRLCQIGKRVTFIYCARSRREAAFLQEIMSLASERIELVWHFDSEVGHSPQIRSLLQSYLPESRVYCCGPEPMLEAFIGACDSLQFSHAAIERFKAASSQSVVAHKPYLLVLRRSGRTLEVPNGQTPLRAILDAGINVDFGCGEGVCGACESRVIEGIVDHRDDLLSKHEKASNKTMLICVSGCKSDKLVLDL